MTEWQYDNDVVNKAYSSIPSHFVNPQEDRPYHLQPPPKVSYPGLQKCAVFIKNVIRTVIYG